MEIKHEEPSADVGVIVGRFQAPDLHEMHLDLINTVRKRHSQVIIFLGLAPTKVTKRDPLDFALRRQMIADAFPDIDDIYYIDDNPNDEVWSKNLDREIAKHVPNESNAILYGSRDSFISHYHGHFQTAELVSDRVVSASEIRKVTAHKRRAGSDFRAGVIWAVEQGYDHAWMTVDCAVLGSDGRLLMGRKKIDGSKYRFPGGFYKPRTGSFALNAKREVMEETSIEVGTPRFVADMDVDDWRYRNDPNVVHTMLFIAPMLFGSPEAKDDLDEVRWFTLDDLRKNNSEVLVATHRPLFAEIDAWLAAGNKF